MKAINLRPLALFCLCFYFFSALTERGGCEKLIVGSAMGAVSMVIYLIYRKAGKKLWVRSISIVAFAAAFSLVFTGIFIDAPAALAEKYEGTYEVCGRITRVEWSASYGSAYIAHLTVIDGEKADLDVHLESEELFERGDLFSGTAQIGEIGSSDVFDTKEYYAAVGIYRSAVLSDAEYEGSDIRFTDRLLVLNNELTERLVFLLGEDNGGIAASLFLGNKGYLSVRFSSAVKHLGVSHLTALSGMHLAVICAMLSIFLKKLGAKASRLGIILPVIFYMLLTGFFASIVRAGIMLICLNLISLTGKDTDQPTNLGITVFLIAVFDPLAVYDIGLQLSAAATLGIFGAVKLTAPPVFTRESKARARLRTITQPFAIGFYAMFFTMPLVAHYFGSISLISFIITVPFSFAVTAIIWLSPFVLLLGDVPVLGTALCGLCSIIAEAFSVAAEAMGFYNGLTFSDNRLAVMLIMIFFVITLGLVALTDNKLRRRILGAVSAGIGAVFVSLVVILSSVSFNKVTLTGAEVSSGDGFVIKNKEACIAVDISSGSNTMASLLAKSAARGDVYNLDCLVIADPHSAHVRQVSYLEQMMELKAVIMPDSAGSREIGAKMDGVEVLYYEPGEIFDVGAYSLITYKDTYLSRSVVPIIRFTVKTDEKELCYVGSSANEAAIEPDGDWIWLGGYGPKGKQSVEDAPDAALIISDKIQIFCDFEPTADVGDSIILSE